MKKSILYLFLVLAISACKNKPAKGNEEVDTTTVSTSSELAADTTFDIGAIAISDKDLGTFPYLATPAMYSYNYHQEAAEKDIKAVDKEYFAVNGKLLAQEGKTFKINIEKERSDGKRFNSEDVQKYYAEKILALGGVQVNDVEISKASYDAVGKAELIDKNYGFTLDPNLLDRIKTYVIRTKDKLVWIQLCLLNEENGRITILEQAVK